MNQIGNQSQNASLQNRRDTRRRILTVAACNIEAQITNDVVSKKGAGHSHTLLYETLEGLQNRAVHDTLLLLRNAVTNGKLTTLKDVSDTLDTWTERLAKNMYQN